MYSVNNFLKPLGSGERNVQIQDPNLNLIWTLNPFTIRNTFVTGNLIEISLYSGNKIILDFSTTNESQQAISLLQARIDSLRNQSPIYIDKAIEEYSKASNVTYQPTGTLTASTVQEALDQVEYQINSISASASNIFYVPSGDLTALNVQDAIDQVENQILVKNIITQKTPADPTTTSSTAGVMMGLSASITPVISGKLLIIISGDIDNNTNGDGGQVQIRYGTGAAPANGDALTGTTAGGLVKFLNNGNGTANLQRGIFSVNAIVSGLTLSTPVWIDISLAAIGGGTARTRDISISIVEL